MSDRTVGNSVLYEMAQTMVCQEDYPTAIALRKLARAGYTTLDQVDGVSDWVLLATSGIGISRLTAVRRLVRPDWQPPRSRVIKVAERFLSAARFALRFWPVEDLESVIRGSVSLPASDRPVEKRLSLEQFAQATQKALRHCKSEELVQALWQAENGRSGRIPLVESSSSLDVQQQAVGSRQVETSTPDLPTEPLEDDAVRDNDHFAHPRHKRLEIVRRYWSAREKREIGNKEAWARSHFNISARTLRRYEREFLEVYEHSTG